MATKITPKDFVEALKDWSILDVVEAVKAIEDEFGIKAATAVAAVAAAPAAGAGAEPVEEQTEFTVNLTAVCAYFGGPPNNWSKEEVDNNVVGKYSVDQLNASTYDPNSIRLYQFDGALIKGGKPTKFNTRMSTGDKRFIKKQYP